MPAINSKLIQALVEMMSKTEGAPVKQVPLKRAGPGPGPEQKIMDSLTPDESMGLAERRLNQFQQTLKDVNAPEQALELPPQVRVDPNEEFALRGAQPQSIKGQNIGDRPLSPFATQDEELQQLDALLRGDTPLPLSTSKITRVPEDVSGNPSKGGKAVRFSDNEKPERLDSPQDLDEGFGSAEERIAREADIEASGPQDLTYRASTTGGAGSIENQAAREQLDNLPEFVAKESDEADRIMARMDSHGALIDDREAATFFTRDFLGSEEASRQINQTINDVQDLFSAFGGYKFGNKKIKSVLAQKDRFIAESQGLERARQELLVVHAKLSQAADRARNAPDEKSLKKAMDEINVILEDFGTFNTQPKLGVNVPGRQSATIAPSSPEMFSEGIPQEQLLLDALKESSRGTQ